ncbi:hypothetical protein J8273_5532 [Carpediemonas membranifera]|uniref:Uncharacterized protein n=1 Tax=Carpediemonas membranifera TaxID=201153 RepID=A0A8J6E302_9EUKA|nr:hypothetical protein J8273_5532 [Carpediemonas membranifera]|eukprot:KAG9392527.1 hypothetical protein J8273_5532 [Carpediemonas membranifera]
MEDRIASNEQVMFAVTERRAAMDDQLDVLEAGFERLTHENDRLTAEAAAAREEITERDAQISELCRTLDEAKAQAAADHAELAKTIATTEGLLENQREATAEAENRGMELNKLLDEEKAAHAESTAKLESTTAQLEQTSSQLATAHTQISEKIEQISAISSDLDSVRTELGLTRGRLNDTDSALSHEQECRKKEVSSLTRTLEQVKAELSSRVSDLEAELEAMTKQATESESALAATQADFETHKRDSEVSAEEMKRTYERRLEATTALVNEEREKATNASCQANTLSTKLHALEGELIAAVAKADGLQTELTHANTAVSTLTQRTQALDATGQSIRESSARFETRCSVLEAELSSIREANSALTTQLEAARPPPTGPASTQTDIPKVHSRVSQTTSVDTPTHSTSAQTAEQESESAAVQTDPSAVPTAELVVRHSSQGRVPNSSQSLGMQLERNDLHAPGYEYDDDSLGLNELVEPLYSQQPTPTHRPRPKRKAASKPPTKRARSDPLPGRRDHDFGVSLLSPESGSPPKIEAAQRFKIHRDDARVPKAAAAKAAAAKAQPARQARVAVKAGKSKSRSQSRSRSAGKKVASDDLFAEDVFTFG